MAIGLGDHFIEVWQGSGRVTVSSKCSKAMASLSDDVPLMRKKAGVILKRKKELRDARK